MAHLRTVTYKGIFAVFNPQINELINSKHLIVCLAEMQHTQGKCINAFFMKKYNTFC